MPIELVVWDATDLAVNIEAAREHAVVPVVMMLSVDHIVVVVMAIAADKRSHMAWPRLLVVATGGHKRSRMLRDEPVG